jgi:hypothetical protein
MPAAKSSKKIYREPRFSLTSFICWCPCIFRVQHEYIKIYKERRLIKKDTRILFVFPFGRYLFSSFFFSLIGDYSECPLYLLSSFTVSSLQSSNDLHNLYTRGREKIIIVFAIDMLSQRKNCTNNYYVSIYDRKLANTIRLTCLLKLSCTTGSYLILWSSILWLLVCSLWTKTVSSGG